MLALHHLLTILHAFGAAQDRCQGGTCIQPPISGSVKVLEDSQYIVKISGNVVGRMSVNVRQQESSNGTTVIQWLESLEVVMQRGSDKTAMFVESEVVEDLNGGFIMQRLAHQLGTTGTTTMRYVWNADGTVGVTMATGGGAPIEKIEAAPSHPSLKGRYWSELQFRKNAAEGKEHSTMSTLRPEFGLQVVTMQRTLLRREGVPSECQAGVVNEGTVWRTELEGVHLNITETFSAADTTKMLRSQMASPFGELDCQLCQGAQSLESLSAATVEQVLLANSPLPEIVYSVAVKLDNPVAAMAWPGPEMVLYKVRHVGGLALNLPTSGYQRVTRGPDGASELEVLVQVGKTSGEQLKFCHEASAAELSNEEYIHPSALVDSSDPAIVELKTKILAGHTSNDAESRALRLRRGTQQHIKRSTLETGFASASETVKTQEGDCTEHAMLLAALLRADGVPSRLCTGLVYVHSKASLVWHMWTQGLFSGRWMDLDATLDVPFHAGHILTSTSSMVNILTLRSSEMEVLRQIGSLAVDVLNVRSLR